MIRERNIPLIITLLAAFFFLPYLGAVHLFDWDEINFAEAAREMLVTGDWSRVTIGFEPFWEKPPLFIWMQALFMKIFGVGEFAARLPNALAGIITLNLLYKWGRKWFDYRAGAFWALAYLGAITPFFYFKTGIIDPIFNLFILASVMRIARAKMDGDRSVRSYLAAGILIGLAVLTKGPVAVLILGLVMFSIWIADRFVFYFSLKQFFALVAGCLVMASLWFLPETITNGPGVIANFISYQLELLSKPVASHGQPWFYHIVVLAIGCFPLSVFAPARLFGQKRDSELDRWMLAMFWVVLILFSSVTTKIVHYSSLCWFPLAYFTMKYLRSPNRPGMVIPLFYTIIGVSIGAVLVLLPWTAANLDRIPAEYLQKIKDVQIQAILSQNIHWSGWEWIWGALFMLMVLFTSILMMTGKWKNIYFIPHSLIVAFSIGMVGLSVVPKVEDLTQGKVIRFYESLQGEDVYVETLHFKSYAHLFYPRVMPLDKHSLLAEKRRSVLNSFNANEITDLDDAQRDKFGQKMNYFFLHGKLDKPTYLVIERRKRSKVSDNPLLELYKDAGPYLVYKRLPVGE